MTTMTKEAFEAALAKITADYADHPGIAKVIASGSAGNLRDYDEICTAAGENCCDCEMNTTECVEMFEASLEGILSA